MNLWRKLFPKRQCKKYTCNSCHDGGMIKKAENILYMTKYIDGTIVAGFVERHDYRIEACPSKCEKYWEIINDH